MVKQYQVYHQMSINLMESRFEVGEWDQHNSTKAGMELL